MQIWLLAVQRVEDYPGQLSPEILAVVDEGTMEENPHWWPQEVARHKAEIGDEAESWAILTAQIPDDALRSALRPQKVGIDHIRVVEHTRVGEAGQ